MKLRKPNVTIALVAACLWSLALIPACSKQETPPAQNAPQTQAAAPEPAAPATAPPAQPATSESPSPAAAPVPQEITPAGTKEATPSPPKTEPVPDQPAPAAPPPEPVAANESPVQTETAPPPEPAGPAHAAVGSEKCKMCHKIQYESWSASKHAKAAPPVGCETCHGNGGDYAKMTVMKDPVQAKAAGLVLPDKGFCTAKCHKSAGFNDDMLLKAHAHKVK